MLGNIFISLPEKRLTPLPLKEYLFPEWLKSDRSFPFPQQPSTSTQLFPERC
ncbi:MAG: hypothetical protein AB1589_03290 [Cyanobacteriota bacterium]